MTPPAEAMTEQQMMRHLLWHKAIHSEDEGGARIDDYVKMLRERGVGTHVAFVDPFDRSIALAFELVLEQGMDPWHIDLVRFTALYIERVRNGTDIDLITAGKLLHMAWSILKLQSERLRIAAEPLPAPTEEAPSWDEIPLENVDDPDAEFTMRVNDNGAPIDEKIRHKGDRKVTLMELVDALEEARREADQRKRIVEARENEKAARRAKRKGRAEDAAHKDDQEGDIAEVWGRILGRNGVPIPITDIQGKRREDVVKTLVSLLFLARSNRIRLWQEDFPYGTIFIQNPSAHGYVDAKPVPPEPEPKVRVKPVPPKRKPKVEAMQNAQN